MKLNIVFFGSLRETLNVDNVAFELTHGKTLKDLKAELIKSNPRWQALSEPSILSAINHEMADATATVNDGDEIAFFPPVTGG